MDSKAPSLCRLCDVKITSPQDWRNHAKSESHIYKLRLRVAEPGRTVSPPTSSKGRLAPRSDANAPKGSASSSSASSSDEIDSDTDSSSSQTAEFVAEQCLFCDNTSDSFQDNISHMSKDHSFIIPYQEALAVDLESVVACIQYIIYRYRECILCSTHRATPQAIQQHMKARGHCRLDINSETAKFYKPSPDQIQNLSELVRLDDGSLRLPSGKLLSNRTQKTETASRPAHQANGSDSSALASRNADVARSVLEEDPPAPSMQLSQLTRGDQRSLSHLRSHEVRALLSAGMKEVDRSRRQETRSKLKLERAVNDTIMIRSRLGYRVDRKVG